MLQKQLSPINEGGRVAQLGEHEHGMFGVAGSIPVTSTNFLRVHPVEFFGNKYFFGNKDKKKGYESS